MSRFTLTFGTFVRAPVEAPEPADLLDEILELARLPLDLDIEPTPIFWPSLHEYTQLGGEVFAVETNLYARKDEFDFNPDQPRGPDGKWIPAGGGDDESSDDTTPSIADQTAKFNALKTHWADLDRQLLPYAGNPHDPAAEKLINEQLDTVRQMHALNIDQGTKEGIGEPGGPRDVVIVGAGPAGLQAAINGGTEGLDTLMVDQNAAPGGQIGLTSRTENVLGFPAGISGQEYAQDGLEQAQRVGAETKLGVGVTGMSYDPGTGLKTLTLSDGSTVDARSVIVAGGVQFNTLNFPGSEAKGIIYGDSGAVKDMSKGGDAVIVGGGNSAGQATVNVAETADSATLLVRGDSLKESMSPYLIDQLQSAPNVNIRYNSEIASATSEPGTHNLQSLTLKDGSTIPADALGVYIGSSPKTGWADIVDRDPHGFITTGGQGASSPLETNVPGVFAAGDVRAGSMHRVVGAAGEGGMALASAWQYVNNTDFGVKKAAAVRVMVYGARRLSPVPGDRFLAKMVNLDEQEPFTGFDPDASE